MKKRTTHEEFIKKLDKLYPNREWEVLGKYKFNKLPILLRDMYGECLIPPNSLMQRSVPSVKTAIDKTSYTINKFKEKWGNTYSYKNFKYKGARKKSYITCLEHGDFLQDANMHLSGRCGCPQCANNRTSKRVRSNTKEFVSKAEVVHKNKYKYPKAKYTTARTKIEILCPIHGSFWQIPNYHLSGNGCTLCARENTKTGNFFTYGKNRKCTLYLTLFKGEKETFIKIGVTSKTIEKRFKTQTDYKVFPLMKIESYNVNYISRIEAIVLRLYTKLRHIPKIDFAGKTEALDKICTKGVMDFIEGIKQFKESSVLKHFTKDKDPLFEEFLEEKVIKIDKHFKAYGYKIKRGSLKQS